MTEPQPDEALVTARRLLVTAQCVASALEEDCVRGLAPFVPWTEELATGLVMLAAQLDERWCFGTSSHWPIALTREGAVGQLMADALGRSERFPGEWVEPGPGLCLLGGGRDRHLQTAVGAGLHAKAAGQPAPLAVFSADALCLGPLAEALQLSRALAAPVLFVGLGTSVAVQALASGLGLPVHVAEGPPASWGGVIKEALSDRQSQLLMLPPAASEEVLSELPSEAVQALRAEASRRIAVARMKAELEPPRSSMAAGSVFALPPGELMSQASWRSEVDAWDRREGAPS